MTGLAMKILRVQRLTRDAFAPFGDVIELEGARHFPINGGTAERYHDLASVDVTEDGGRPLGSQAFIPLGVANYLTVVAPAGDFDPTRMRAFASVGWQGVNYAKGVWHHPLIALGRVSDFIVVDRGGDQPNCDEVRLPEPYRLEFDGALTF
jgi:ureidoglycolate lyase